MVKIKYTGKGLSSRGHAFSSTKNNGLFEVTLEDSKYLLSTFPRQFELIEKVVEATEDVPAEKKPRAKRTRKKSTEVLEG